MRICQAFWEKVWKIRLIIASVTASSVQTHVFAFSDHEVLLSIQVVLNIHPCAGICIDFAGRH